VAVNFSLYQVGIFQVILYLALQISHFQNDETRVRTPIHSLCSVANIHSRGSTSGNKLKMTLGLPVYGDRTMDELETDML
jgi:hypothetical protein